MDTINVIWNVPHAKEWGILIALYFYFTGISAGSCHYSSIYTLLDIKKYKPLAKYAALIAFLGFLVTPICLIVDLEQPLRTYYLFYMFNPTSVFLYGTIMLTIYPMALLAYVWYLYNEDKFKAENRVGFLKLGRGISILVLPLAVAVHAYTGFVFGVLKTRGYLYTAIMPLYFLMGAIISGFALILIFSVIKNVLDKRRGKEEEITDDLIQTSRKLLAWVLVVYPLFVFSHIAMMLYGPADAHAAAMIALHEPMYLIGDILLGAVTPLFLLVYPRTRTSYTWMSIAGALALVGVLFARYTIVVIGQVIPLS